MAPAGTATRSGVVKVEPSSPAGPRALLGLRGSNPRAREDLPNRPNPGAHLRDGLEKLRRELGPTVAGDSRVCASSTSRPAVGSGSVRGTPADRRGQGPGRSRSSRRTSCRKQ